MVISSVYRRVLRLGVTIILAVSLLIGLAVSLPSTPFFPLRHHVTHLLAGHSYAPRSYTSGSWITYAGCWGHLLNMSRWRLKSRCRPISC